MSAGFKSMKISVPEQINKWLARFLFLAALCIFVIAATHNLNSYFPFSGEDEYYKFRVAMKFMQIFSGQAEYGDLSSLPTHCLAPFFMYNEYVGWPALYVAVALMSVFGKTFGYFFIFRLAAVMFGVLTLVSIRFVLRRWFDEWTASLAVFFVGCNFSYIQPVRHGFYREAVFQVCGLWFGLALCMLAQQKRKRLFLYFGFFVFGLALWAKIMFVAYIVGALAALVIVRCAGRDFIENVFPFRRHTLVAAAVAFVCGAGPFVWFNVRNGFPTARLMFSRLFGFFEVLEADNSWNNSAVFENVLRRIHDFRLYLSGKILLGDLDDSVGVIYVTLFICAFVWGCVTLFRRQGDDGLRLRLRVLFVFYAVVLLLTCFVPFGHNIGQILVMVPFAGILCALFLVHVARLRGLLFVPVLVCGLWFNEQLGYFQLFSHKYLQEGQCYGLLDREPELLTAWLKAHRISSVICTDPLGSVLEIAGREPELEFFDFAYANVTSADLVDMLGSLMLKHPAAYLLIASNGNYGASREIFAHIKNSAGQNGIGVEIVDSKQLRKDPAHTVLLCRVFWTDKKDTRDKV